MLKLLANVTGLANNWLWCLSIEFLSCFLTNLYTHANNDLYKGWSFVCKMNFAIQALYSLANVYWCMKTGITDNTECIYPYRTTRCIIECVHMSYYLTSLKSKVQMNGTNTKKNHFKLFIMIDGFLFTLQHVMLMNACLYAPFNFFFLYNMWALIGKVTRCLTAVLGSELNSSLHVWVIEKFNHHKTILLNY